MNRNISKTDPVLDESGNIRGSSFQVDYNGEQFTMTNLHVCKLAIHGKYKLIQPSLTWGNNVINLGVKVRVPLDKDDMIGQLLRIGHKKQKILAYDKQHDLCILTPDLEKPSFSLANSYSMQEKISVVGHPRGLPKTVREGRIIDKTLAIFPWLSVFQFKSAVMITAIGYGGNSGSPIIDKFGRLVGVLFAGSRAYHTEMLVVPLESVKRFLEEQTK